MAHLKNGSLRVSTGDRVARGQQLAQVGNSGQTTEPHLHLQIQNKPEFSLEENSFNKPWYLVTNTVLGLASTRTYPILFRNVTRTRNGDESRSDEAWVQPVVRLLPLDGVLKPGDRLADQFVEPLDAGMQIRHHAPERLKQAQTVAMGCDRLPIAAHGKEGVDGSSPSEGFEVFACLAAASVV